MKKSVFLLIFALVLVLCSCAEPAADIPAAVTTDRISTTAPTTTAPPPTSDPAPVYECLNEYLLPPEDYSWERKYDPEFVMIHFTSAVTTHRDDPYNISLVRDIFVEYNLSVHYIIDRDGTIRCYIPEDRVAWHAGAGTFLDDERYTNQMNQYAIGIELLAIGSEADMAQYLTAGEYQALDDSLKGFTQEQYDALKVLVEDICSRNGIPMDRDHVIGHEDYSPKKTDPGELFDWSQLFPTV